MVAAHVLYADVVERIAALPLGAVLVFCTGGELGGVLAATLHTELAQLAASFDVVALVAVVRAQVAQPVVGVAELGDQALPIPAAAIAYPLYASQAAGAVQAGFAWGRVAVPAVRAVVPGAVAAG
jgi:hypothetical protein